MWIVRGQGACIIHAVKTELIKLCLKRLDNGVAYGLDLIADGSGCGGSRDWKRIGDCAD